MSSREEILGRLRGLKTEDGGPKTEVGRRNMENGTSDLQLPTSNFPLPSFDTAYLGDPISKFKELIEILHGEAIEVDSTSDIQQFIEAHYAGKRVLINTFFNELNNVAEWQGEDPHALEDVEFALFEGKVGVAENGAVWFNDELMGQRVAPFINQQLGILLKKENLVPTMPQAYDKLGDPDSGFGVFIAGPSKTADIEQSLVTGAHGARGLVVFLI